MMRLPIAAFLAAAAILPGVMAIRAEAQSPAKGLPVPGTAVREGMQAAVEVRRRGLRPPLSRGLRGHGPNLPVQEHAGRRRWKVLTSSVLHDASKAGEPSP